MNNSRKGLRKRQGNDQRKLGRPLSLRLTQDVDTIVRSIPDSADWLRRKIEEALINDGYKSKSI